MIKYREIHEEIIAALRDKKFDYGTQYPEINSKFVFSISSLASGSANQIWKKKHPGYSFNDLNISMMIGKAIHEHIQNRMKYWLIEYPIAFKTEKFTLIGHIDLVDFSRNIILEVKSTKQKNVDMKKFILQTGTYARILEKQFDYSRIFDTFIVLLNKNMLVYQLTAFEKENSFKKIMQNAEEAYEKLK